MQLRGRRRGIFSFDDSSTAADHFCQSPVGDAVSVRKAPTEVPEVRIGETIDVLEELPRQAALTNARDSDDRDQERSVLSRRGVQELLHEPKFAVASDEGRLEPRGLKRPADSGDDA